jgi:outer membrane protein assembly factor BamB
MRRAVVTALIFVALAGAGVGVAVLIFTLLEPDDVRGSASTQFIVTEPEEEPGASTRPEPAVREEPWPTYGYDVRRTRVAVDFDLSPPFRTVWTFRGGSLLEFPPVVAYGRLYFGTNRGRFFALEATTGKIAWKRDFGRCIAASPTVSSDVVYQPLMDPSPCAKHDQDAPGFLVALDADTGKQLWRFRSGVNESSPLLVKGVLYFGTWDGKVYAVDARTGEQLWTFQTDDKVKGGAAYAKGILYIGSYDGHLYALDAQTGAVRWESEAQGGLTGSGNFYATPTVAYGRVFIGNTDGRVYAFGAETGDLLWSHSTGDYVYSSAAVFAQTVYVGSYDDKLYALDAATGDERWSFEANGNISGAPTVLAGNVYFSTLRGRTYALDARTGDRIWTFPDGKYTPVVADRERVYLTGFTRVYALEPTLLAPGG